MKRKRVRINDISISYLSNDLVNPEVTLLFIHGFPFNKNMWLPQFTGLPDNIRLIAPDVRGQGGSTSGHGIFSIDVFADDLIDFINRLGIEEVVLCGCSMGGYIALRAYEKSPSIFKGIILNSTHSFADTNEIKENRFESIQAVLRYGKRVFAIGFVDKVFTRKSIQEKPGAVDLIKSTIRRNSERNICATQMAMAARTDTTPSLSNIRVPVLIIRGEEDQIVTFSQVKTMVAAIPDVRHVEIAGCAHLPNLEKTTRFNGELKNFLISKIMN